MNILRQIRTKVAQSPGTVEYTGPRRVDRVRISVMDYRPDMLQENEDASIDECLAFRDSANTSWIDFVGLHDTATLERIGDHFGIHPLILEDIVNVDQRPKLEDQEVFLYIVLRFYHAGKDTTDSEQVSLVIGPNYVLSFRETDRDIFAPVRERIRGGRGRIRKMGTDYLAYALLDAVVDNYFVVLEQLGQRVEEIEAEIMEETDEDVLQQVHTLKRELTLIRKSVWPLREVAAGLLRGDSKLVHKATTAFLRDAYDHTVQVGETIDSLRELVSSLHDLYLSMVSNRMNEVMKVLTIIATLFVPLSFFAGVFGMNFQYMPELGWKWGYLVFWAVVVSAVTMMLLLFRRKRWF